MTNQSRKPKEGGLSQPLHLGACTASSFLFSSFRWENETGVRPPARNANPIERARTSSEAGAAAASVVCSLGEGSAYGGRVRARERATQAVLLMENIQVALFLNWGMEIVFLTCI